MKKILCITLCFLFLTGCKDSTITLPYSQQEIILKGNAKDPKYYESNTFYDETLKNEVVDIVNTITYGNSKINAKRIENAKQVSTIIDGKEIIIYENGDVIIDNDGYHASNGEQVYKELQVMLQDAVYEAYSNIYKINGEHYIIDTSISFDNNSQLGTFDNYKINLPVSYSLEPVVIADDILKSHQDIEKQWMYENAKVSVLAVSYAGEPRAVQKEVENANISVLYSKNNKVIMKKTISLAQRCTLILE